MGTYFAIIWLTGWLAVSTGIYIFNRKELRFLQFVSRFMLCFFSWPLLLYFAIYLRYRGEI